MLDRLLEALTAPIKASFTRLMQPSTSLPEFRPLLVLALVFVCLMGGVIQSAVAIRDSCSRAAVSAGIWLVAALALASGLVCTVPAEASDIAYAFHAVFKFFTTFTSWPFAVAYFLYRSLVFVIEATLTTCFALVAAVLPAVFLFMLCNFCICMAVGCIFAGWAVLRVFCSSVQQRSSPSPFQNPADDVQLTQAAQAASDASRAHQLALQAASYPGSDQATALQQLWTGWLATQADDQVLWTARRLTTATMKHSADPSYQEQPLSPVPGFDKVYTLWAAEAILPRAQAEHLLRYDYDQTVFAKLGLFFHRLSGFLLQTFLPLPSLHDRFRPFEADLFYGVLLSPFAVISVLRHPDNWTRSGLDGPERIEPGTSPALEELLTTAVQFLHSVFGPSPRTADRERAKQQLSAVLEEAATRMRAERAHRHLPDAVLDAVLLWKARKDGR